MSLAIKIQGPTFLCHVKIIIYYQSEKVHLKLNSSEKLFRLLTVMLMLGKYIFGTLKVKGNSHKTERC